MDKDQHWEEVLRLAEKYGFIVYAGGGVAVLATHQVQKELDEAFQKRTKVTPLG